MNEKAGFGGLLWGMGWAAGLTKALAGFFNPEFCALDYVLRALR